MVVDLVAALVFMKFAVVHIEDIACFQPGTKINEKYAVALVKWEVPVWSPAMNFILGM